MNVVRFPGAVRAKTPPPAPEPASLADQLEAAELALIQARVRQLNAETRQLNGEHVARAVRRLAFWLFVAWLVYALSGPAGAEPSRNFYDGQGRFAGSSLTRGNSTTFYDAGGRFSGSALERGKTRTFYDRQGRYSGSSINR